MVRRAAARTAKRCGEPEETTLREVQASPAELTAVRLEVCVHRSQARPREFVALRWLSKDLSLQ